MPRISAPRKCDRSLVSGLASPMDHLSDGCRRDDPGWVFIESLFDRWSLEALPMKLQDQSIPGRQNWVSMAGACPVRARNRAVAGRSPGRRIERVTAGPTTVGSAGERERAAAPRAELAVTLGQHRGVDLELLVAAAALADNDLRYAEPSPEACGRAITSPKGISQGSLETLLATSALADQCDASSSTRQASTPVRTIELRRLSYRHSRAAHPLFPTVLARRELTCSPSSFSPTFTRADIRCLTGRTLEDRSADRARLGRRPALCDTGALLGAKGAAQPLDGLSAWANWPREHWRSHAFTIAKSVTVR